MFFYEGLISGLGQYMHRLRCPDAEGDADNDRSAMLGHGGLRLRTARGGASPGAGGFAEGGTVSLLVGRHNAD
jgi:hypothetical protein